MRNLPPTPTAYTVADTIHIHRFLKIEKIISFPHFLFLSTADFTMATKEALDALQKTDLALQDIRTKLQPFLATLESHAENNNNISSSSNNQGPKPAKLALSQTAVALSLGTLRFMGARLRGRKVDDKVRNELNHMRKLLVTLQQQQPQGKQSQSKQAKQKVKAQAQAAVKAPAVTEKVPEPVSSPAAVAKVEASPKTGSKRKDSSSQEASKRSKSKR
jgi:hypothetical protein